MNLQYNIQINYWQGGALRLIESLSDLLLERGLHIKCRLLLL